MNSNYDTHVVLYNKAVKFLNREKVDVVITTGEPFILFKYGFLLKKKFGIKWIADYRDGWFHNHVKQPGVLGRILHYYELHFEKKYISICNQ